MRLINTETGEFEEFVDLAKTPPYAILSHTWDPTGEQTYQEVVKIQEKYRPQRPLPQEDALPDSRSNAPGPVPGVLTPSEAHATVTSSHSPLLVSQGNPRSRSMWRRLALSEPEPPSVDAAPSNPELPDDIHTPSPPPTTLRSIWDSDSGLSEKVRKACEIARRDGYRYIWIDSCCINKDSSSELSEAINSMFNWYRGSQICYAFLPDVPSDEDVRAQGSKFRKSRWFTRGWTLQELIAPLVVVFLSQAWEGLGTKDILADVIQDVTSIDRGILRHETPLSDESVADRMRWAADRRTTRVEDEAYSLLGIFGITMPTLYGEGRYAFRRLQEEILQRIPDQSLFAWGSECIPFPLTPALKILVGSVNDPQTPFAPSPHSFASSRDRIIPATGYSVESLNLPVEEYTHTPYGIRTQFCLLPLKALNPGLEMSGGGSATVLWYLFILRSWHANDPQRLLGRLCFLPYGYRSTVPFLHVPDWIIPPAPPDDRRSLDGRRRNALIFTLSLDDLERVWETQLQTKTVYLPHPKPSMARRRSEGKNGPVRMALPEWNRAALRMRGYAISDIRCPHVAAGNHSNMDSASLTLSHPSIRVHIEYRQMLIRSSWVGYRRAVVIQARIWLLPPGPNADLSESASDSGSPQAIQSTPPYTSAIWADDEPWAMTLPARTVSLPTDSGDAVSFRLGLDLTAPSRYNVRVEVAPTGRDSAIPGASGSPRPDVGDLPRVLNAPHETFRLVLPGSVRRALEMKGYSVYLELGPSIGRFHSHSLMLSGGAADSRFVIGVKLFHTLDNDGLVQDSQELVVVARVTLESASASGPSVPSCDGSEIYQDGPYVAIWNDMIHTWTWSWEEKHVVLTTPTEEPLILRLGFDFAWKSEYYLHVDVEPEASRFRRPELWAGRHVEYPYSLNGIHESVVLTLPGHTKRALQREGYQVRFEELDVSGRLEGDPARYRLTLSKVDAGFVIVVDYSHSLTTNSAEPDYVPSMASDPDFGQPADSDSEWCDTLRVDHKTSRRPRLDQELTFQACVKALPSPSSGSQGDIKVAARGESACATVDWSARHPRVGVWRRHLPRKDITLVLPTRRRLTIRLGFYLVWYSEYCLMVEINPRMALSRTTSRPNPPPISPDDSFEFEASRMQMPAGWPPYARPLPLRVSPRSAEVDDELFLPDIGTLTTPETVHFQSAELAEMQGAGDPEDGERATPSEMGELD